jgi:hypothetical protein
MSGFILSDNSSTFIVSLKSQLLLDKYINSCPSIFSSFCISFKAFPTSPDPPEINIRLIKNYFNKKIQF